MSSEDTINEMVGSVAEETARLLESLRRSQGEPGEEHDVPVQPSEEPPCSCGHGHELTAPVRMGEAASCTYCPICRGVTLARALTPETLGRLAEVASLAASVLRDLATAPRGGAASGESAEPPEPAPRPPSGERIVVVDEDE